MKTALRKLIQSEIDTLLSSKLAKLSEKKLDFYNRGMSNEVKEKLRKANLGKKISKEAIEKMKNTVMLKNKDTKKSKAYKLYSEIMKETPDVSRKQILKILEEKLDIKDAKNYHAWCKKKYEIV